MATRVVVDPDVCVGSADCTLAAPEAFEIDATDEVATVRPGAASVPLEQLRRAEYRCPTGAITVEADEGGA